MKIIECPRDAMQGWHQFIPTEQKISYLNMLGRVGFDTLDMGSFVSPKAVPQMKDTAEVLDALEDTNSKLLTIVANTRGAMQAMEFEKIDCVGFPFSVSETFQKRNTNKSIDASLSDVDDIFNLAEKNNKTLVVYLSMAFGNPYGENWHHDIVAEWGRRLSEMGVSVIALSDTIGVSNPETISHLFSLLITEVSDVEWGAHLHTKPNTWREKIEAAYNSGCRRFDGAIKGYGGCPMAINELVGNMPTEKLLSFAQEKKESTSVNTLAFESAFNKAIDVFI